ncbi:MAG: sulfite exporter TauE/SafE family protein [Hyphomicrobiales bacterium]
MIIGLPAGELAILAGVLLAGGALTGVLAGLFGVGGGAILVPVLYELFGFLGTDEAVRMHLSVATSLAVIIPTSIRSFSAHHAKGAVDMDMLRYWAPYVFFGVILGSLVIAVAPSQLLRVIFAVMMILIAARLVFANERWRLGDDLPQNPARALWGGAIGLFSVLMGVGGGAMFSTIMMLYSRPIHQAVATSSGLGIVISIPATIGFIISGWSVSGLPPGSLGYVNLIGFVLIIPSSIAFAPLGVKLAHALSQRHLELAFATFLFGISVRFFWSLA